MLFKKTSRHQPRGNKSLCIWHVMLDFHDPGVQCEKWNISLVPSRLNAPIVLGWLNNLTLPASFSLKLLTWWLEYVVGLLLTRLATAVYCPLRWWLRTFEMGTLAMWMMENVHYLSEQLFLVELSPVSQMSWNLSPPRAEPVKRGLPTFSSILFTVIWVKNCRSKKGIK